MKKHLSYARSLLFFFYFYTACAEEISDPLHQDSVKIDFAEGIHFDVRNPTYANGEIYTESGGVLCGEDFRIQAMQIRVLRGALDEAQYSVEASGSLMVQYGPNLFIGERIEYDFLTKTGTIFCGRTMVEPWFFGGEQIHLLADGSYQIEKAYATTSESEYEDWAIVADLATLSPDHFLEAKNLKLKILQLPVFWVPSMRVNLDWIFDAPIKYHIKWGGNQGHRFGLAYKLFTWNNWTSTLLLEYRLKYGLGGGIESSYRSQDKKTVFHSINYAARDASIIHPDQRFRYRFKGVGDTLLFDDRVTAHLSYDKVSDIDMPTDLDDKGLELRTVLRTELLLRNQDENRISSLTTRLRINNFQTVKEQLPTFATSFRPVVLGSTKIISESSMKLSYLDFSYGNNQVCVHDYRSTRLEFSPLFYRHFTFRGVNVTPEAGGVLIGYGNSPDHSAKCLAVGKLGCQMNMRFWRNYINYKHIVVPYLNYTYYSMPTVLPGGHKGFDPNGHYIFDIEDGWYRLSMLRFGVLQSVFHKRSQSNRVLAADIYANAFFNTHTFSQSIPKAYAQVTWKPFLFLTNILDTGWDFIHNEVDHFNFRTEWTFDANLAAFIEYRHRSRFDWRKADRTNFILDSFLSISELEKSQLSDRRDTLLFHLFYRFHPSWAFEFESRYGWNRIEEPPYTEFEIDLLGRLRSSINFKLSYQHREDDDRLSVYFSIGLDRPSWLFR